MGKFADVITIIASICVIAVCAMIINDHVNIACLFGHCVAVVK